MKAYFEALQKSGGAGTINRLVKCVSDKGISSANKDSDSVAVNDMLVYSPVSVYILPVPCPQHYWPKSPAPHGAACRQLLRS